MRPPLPVPSLFDRLCLCPGSAHPSSLDRFAHAVAANVGSLRSTLVVRVATSCTGAAYKGASDLYIDANTQLAIQAGRELYEKTGRKTVILVPDGPELSRSAEMFKSALALCDGVAMSHLFEGREPLQQGLQSLFGMDKTSNPPAAATEADVHIVINISTGELPDTQKYLREVRLGLLFTTLGIESTNQQEIL